MEERKYFTVYKITNNKNGKFYIGVHSTFDLNDGYMGSGIHISNAIKKYSLENFTKEYLFFALTEQDAFYIEKELIVLGSMSYNIANGGEGGNVFSNLSEEQKEHQRILGSINSKKFWNNITPEQYKRKQEIARNIAKTRDNAFLIERNKNIKYFGEKNHFFGKKHTLESKEKMRLVKLGKKRVVNG